MNSKLIIFFVSLFLIGIVSACYCGDGVCSVSDDYFENCENCPEDCGICEPEAYCGDANLDPGEECDDGNLINGDGCNSICEIEEIEECEHDVGIRYSYQNSFSTGIAIKFEDGNWISNTPAELTQGKKYIVKYYIDNHFETPNNIHVILKLDNFIIIEYDSPINTYHYKEVELDTTQFNSGNYNLILEVEKINEVDCNIEDNTAFREIIITEEIINESVCGDDIIDPGEECDDGTDNGKRCDNSRRACEYCSNSCKIIEREENSDDNSNNNNGFLELLNFCEPNWKCSGWSDCSGEIMTRTCEDTNRCDFSYNKPSETTDCDLINQVLASDQQDQDNKAILALLVIGALILIGLLVTILNKL